MVLDICGRIWHSMDLPQYGVNVEWVWSLVSTFPNNPHHFLSLPRVLLFFAHPSAPLYHLLWNTHRCASCKKKVTHFVTTSASKNTLANQRWYATKVLWLGFQISSPNFFSLLKGCQARHIRLMITLRCLCIHLWLSPLPLLSLAVQERLRRATLKTKRNSGF